MTPWIQLGSLIVVFATTVWTILRSHRIDEEAKRKIMWDRIDSFRKELQTAKDDLLTLQGEVKAMPSRDMLDDRLDRLEDKLEKKFDDLSEVLRELLKSSLGRKGA